MSIFPGGLPSMAPSRKHTHVREEGNATIDRAVRADPGFVPDAAREAVSSFDLVAELTHAFAASRCVTKTLDLALRRIGVALQAEGGAVFLLDDPPTTLTCVACCGPVSLTGMSLPVGEGIIGRSIRTGRGEVIDNVALDGDFPCRGRRHRLPHPL